MEEAMTKSTLLLTSAICALTGLTWAGSAAAQAAPTSGTSATEVGAVIVTAEKRAQNLQKVPVAVTAFTTKQRDLVGIENLQDMTNFTPGLVYSSVLDRVTLRGIGRQTNLLSAEAAVSTYVDGFFTTSAVEASKPPMFVSNIEVLRGPQGTLQGRNSIGGALLVTTARPTSSPYAEARVTLGNYGYTDVQAAVSGPLADGLRFRVQGYYDQQNQGYFKNVANGATEGGNLNQYYIEPSISAKLGDNADLYVKAFTAGWHNIAGPGARSNYLGGAYGNQLNDASNQYLFNAAAAYNPANLTTAGGPILAGSLNQTNPNITGNPALGNIHNFSTNSKEFVHLSNSNDFDGEFTYHFPTFDVKYTGGFQSYKYDLNVDADNTDVNSYTIANVANPTCAAGGATCLTVNPTWNYFYEENNQWYSHEITFASTTNSPLQWIGGLYYYDEHYSNPIITTDPQQTQLTNPYSAAALLGAGAFVHTAAANPNDYVTYQNYSMETRSEAVYGQLDWKATDTIKLTGGLRYTADHKNGTEYERLVFFGGSILGGLYAPGALNPLVNPWNPNYNGLLTGFGIPAVGALDVTSCPTPVTVSHAKGVTAECFINSAGMAQRGIGGDFSGTTGTAGLEWTPTSDTLGYLRYSRGYKAGGFNAGNLSEYPETKPEFVNSYEAGVKKSFGRNLIVDAAVYYYDFQDAQYPVSTPQALAGGGSQNVSLLTNIPKTRSDGFELETIWTPIDHLQLNLSYSFNDTAILTGCSYNASTTTFSGLCLVDTNDPLGQFSGAKTVGTSGGEAVQSVKGNQLPNAPRNKVSLNANYTFVFDTGSLTLSGTYMWRDVQYGAVFKEAYNEAPSWSQVDLRATWKGNNDKYEVAVYGRNVFNTVGYEAAAPGLIYSTGSAANAYRVATNYGINPPATYGIELHYKFF
jgi:iron complex outermembrane receptor protein